MRRPVPSTRRVQPWRGRGINASTAVSLLSLGMFCYAAWLTSIVFCASNDCRPLLIAAALFFPVGIVHGIGVWLGGW